jgi:hypothetical protein
MSAQGAPVRKRQKNAIQNPPIVHPRNPANLVRQQRGYHRPLEIRQIETSHPTLHRCKVESLFAKNGNPLYEFMT